MDISAFEATTSGGGDEPELKDVLLLVDEDLQVPIKAVIAVVKHVGRLFIFVVALGMCVTIYCFTVSWICLFWLQTRMLFATSSLLHRCLDEPTAPKYQWVDLYKPVAAPKTRREAESPPPKPRSAWTSHPQTACAKGGISLGATSLEDAKSPLSSGSMSPKRQPLRRDSFVPSDNQDGVGNDVLGRLLQREREIEAERNASPLPRHDAPEQDATADEQAAEELEEQPSEADFDQTFEAELDPRAGAPSIVADHVQDDVQSSEAIAAKPFGFTAEQMAEAARFAAEATKGGDKKKNRPGPPAYQSHRTAAPPQRKLSKEEQKVQAHSNWISSMTTSKGKKTATRVQQSTGTSALRATANKPPVPAAAGQKAVRMPLKQTTNGTIPKWSEMGAILRQNESSPVPSPMTSAAASPAAHSSTPVPPHVRKVLEVMAKKAADEGNAKAIQEAQAAAVAAALAAAMAQAHAAKPVVEEQEEAAVADTVPKDGILPPGREQFYNPEPVVEQSHKSVSVVEDMDRIQVEETRGEPTAVHDRMQDGRHAVFEDLLTKPPLKVDAVGFRDIEEPEQAIICENSGMHDHEVSDCGICPECDRSDSEPCSKHPVPTARGAKEEIDHAVNASSNVPRADPSATTAEAVSSAPQRVLTAVGPTKETDAPVPSSRREATPVDLIELKSSGELRSSRAPAPDVQMNASPWRSRAPSFFFPPSKSPTNDFDHAAESNFRPHGSLPHLPKTGHARPTADPFAAGPFQTDWWSNNQAAMSLQPSTGYGKSSASPSSFPPSVPEQQLYGMNPFARPHYTHPLHVQKPKPETLTDRAIRLDGLAPKPIVPPGLGGPQAGRQANFDALLAPNDVPKLQQGSGYDQEISKAQHKMRQLVGLQESDTRAKMKDSATVADLKDFSSTFNIPEAFAREIVVPSSSGSAEIEIKVEDTEHNIEVPSDGPATVATGNEANAPVAADYEAQNVTSEETLPTVSDSAQDVQNTQSDPEAEKAGEAKKLATKLSSARDTQEKQNEGANLIPDELTKLSKINEYVNELDDLSFDENGEKKITSADTGDSSGQDEVKSAKQALREQKKAAREAVKVAWLERDIARASVIGTWTIENANKLKAATASYHGRRAELASLMADGKLHDDDARVYQVFADIDLSEPKNKPEGASQLRRRIKERLSSSSSTLEDSKATTDAEPPAADVEVQKAKAKLVSARSLRQHALNYFKQPQPQSNIRYETWKDAGNKKLARANAYYKKKREELIAFFPNTGLPADLEAEFPGVL